MDKYIEVKEILNDMSSVKMQMNAHKGNIENCSPHDILVYMQKEVSELKEIVDQIFNDKVGVDGRSLLGVIEEAADIQNFLLALVHKAVNEYRSRK